METSPLLVQANCDGQFFVFDPARGGAPLLRGRIVDEEFILYTPEGYYTATYEGAHYIHVAFPGIEGVHSFEQFAAALERRDVIRAILKGARSPLPAPALKPPPNVETKADAEAADTVAVRISAQSNTGLAAVALYEDGLPVLRFPASGPRLAKSVHLPRKPHARTLAAVAIDTSGFKSRAASIDLTTRLRPDNALHVVAVGIDAYDHADSLAFARTDADTIARAVTESKSGYYARVNLKKRLDRDAAPAAVLEDLRTVTQQAAAEDTILLFFAGHGARTPDGRYFMLTSSSDPARLPEAALEWASMSNLLTQAKGRVIVILDACHSGQTGVQTTNDEAVASLTAAAHAPLIVLAASKGRQESLEMPEKGGGVFTQSLARILGVGRTQADTNGDGLLDVSEVYSAVRQAVLTATGGRQTPWLARRNMVGDFPLF